MAAKTHGRLAAVELTGTTPTKIYQPGSGRKATITIVMENLDTSNAVYAIAIETSSWSAPTTPANEYFLEYGNTLYVTGPNWTEKITIGSQDQVVAYLTTGTGPVAVNVFGIEEDV